MIHNKVVIWSSYSFEKKYAEYHIMLSRIKALLDRGAEVLLIQKSFSGANCVPQEIAGYTNMKAVAIPFREPQKQSFIVRYLKELTYYLKSFRYVPKSTIVFIQSSFAAWMPIMLIHYCRCHNRIIYNVQDIFPENAAASGTLSKGYLVYNAFYRLQSWSYRWANKIITISDDMKQTISAHNIPENKIEVIYNWSDYEQENCVGRQNAYTLEMGIPENKFRVVYAGNIGVMQNVISILHAAEKIQDENIHFYIIGDGAEKAHIEEYLANKKLMNVTLLPATSADDAWKVYRMADVNVVPLVSGGIFTAFPSKIAACIQAQRYIILCIDLDSKTALRFKNDPQSEVIEANNPSALAQAIKCVYRQKSTEKSNSNSENMRQLFSKEMNCTAYANSILDIENTIENK